ncbi:hypothetical protein BH11PAT4_BH11PAT4_1120 [soil metagenome]
MNSQPFLYGIIGLLAGIVIAGFAASYAVNNNNGGMMRTFGMHSASNASTAVTGGMDMMDHAADSGDMSMNNMVSELSGRTGDDFDKAFLSEMIGHHQGAINMAKLAAAQAKHQEVKDLANGIITAQTSEIAQMKQWQGQWGY